MFVYGLKLDFWISAIGDRIRLLSCHDQPSYSGISLTELELIIQDIDVPKIELLALFPIFLFGVRRQLEWLPDCSPGYDDNQYCGLVCKRNDSGCSASFKVLLIKLRKYVYEFEFEFEYVFDGAIFCSETGEWSESLFSFPRELAPRLRYLDDFVTSNGILYSLSKGVDEHSQIHVKGIVAFDLSVDGSSTSEGDPIRCFLIDLPVNFGPQAPRNQVCLGVVQGQLRLSKLVKTNGGVVLKVWELDCSNSDVDWVLVHEVRLKWGKNTSAVVAAFYPNSGDIIFMSVKIYKIEIGEEKHRKVYKFWDPFNYCKRKDFTENLQAFTLVNPSWPTSIPTFSLRNSRSHF